MAATDRRRVADMTVREQIIQEEFKIWKKNSPFLYDFVKSQTLESPTLTLQWLPGLDSSRLHHYNVHSLLFGTNMSRQETNYIKIADVVFPTGLVEGRPYDDEKADVGCGDITVTKKIVHESEVNRARYMPQLPHIIATKTGRGDVLVFDTAKHPAKPPDGECRPDVRLIGHSKKGYGLAWSPLRSGVLIDSSYDQTICQWTLEASSSSLCKPQRYYRGHTDNVEDVCWHSHDESKFVSIGHEGSMMVWDTRSEAPSQIVHAHTGVGTSVAFNPFSAYVIVTGGADKTVALWDFRNLGKRLHSFSSHNDQIIRVAWSNKVPTILASASADRRVNVWDLSRINRPQEPDDSEDGPPELLFVHGGHTGAVVDLAWNPVEDWTIASTAIDNVIQIWEMATNIHEPRHDFNGGDDQPVDLSGSEKHI